MKKQQRLLRGCLVVTPEQVQTADILIQDEWIVAVGPELSANADTEVFDAAGLVALPGGIDGHVHLREPGAECKEDFISGTQAALAGGVTTVLDMPNTPLPATSSAAFAEKAALARSKACCDFGLFIGATGDNAENVAACPDAVGLKLFMGSSTGNLLVADLAGQYKHFRTYPAHTPIAVHAEDETAVQLLSNQERRPPLCAELAVSQAIALARATHRRLHICHISTLAELALVRMAKSQGLAVTAEVTPHHLFLNQDDALRLGPLGMMNPPLRSETDVQALWQDLKAIDMIASDHAPHTLAEKNSTKPPSGVPGLETTLPLLLDAEAHDMLKLTDIARLTAAGPASVYQLPHKGRLAPGYHADIVLVDMQQKTVLGEWLFTKCQWSPFAGRTTYGRIERVLLRGQDAFVSGHIMIEPGQGRFITPQR